jgi:hypothetical protein
MAQEAEQRARIAQRMEAPEPQPEPEAAKALRAGIRQVEQRIPAARKDIRDAGTSMMAVAKAQSKLRQLETQRDELLAQLDQLLRAATEDAA